MLSRRDPMLKKILVLLVSLSTLTACGKSQTPSQTVSDVSPIIDSNGADPWIFKDGETYYYTKTTGNNVTLWRSNQLSTVAFGKEKVIWEMPVEFESAWAPELHRIDEQWVVYLALNEFGDTHRMYALTNDSADPFEGEWRLTKIDGMPDRFAIDGTILETADNRYFIWSGWEVDENIAQNLYLAKMKSPTVVEDQAVMISQPEYDWEKRQKPLINEGPEIWIENDTINLVYSASGSWDNDYSLGLITADLSSDLLSPKSWSKSKEPIFTQTEDVFGPGHNGFVKDKDGQGWLIYHAARWSHSGWERSIRLQTLSFKNDKMTLEPPYSETKLTNLPNGDRSRIRVMAKDAERTNGLHEIEDHLALGEHAIRGFSDTTDHLTFTVDLAEAGDYTVLAYVKTVDNSVPNNKFGAELTINAQRHRLEVVPADYYQPIGITLPLKKGQNTIQFNLEVGLDEVRVSRIELVPVN